VKFAASLPTRVYRNSLQSSTLAIVAAAIHLSTRTA
jgi:hypothetical protein